MVWLRTADQARSNIAQFRRISLWNMCSICVMIKHWPTLLHNNGGIPREPPQNPNTVSRRRETMERSHTPYSVTLLRLMLSATLLIALSAPLAAHTQAQQTDQWLTPAAKAVDAVIQGPGAAIGGLHDWVTPGPVGLAIAQSTGSPACPNPNCNPNACKCNKPTKSS